MRVSERTIDSRWLQLLLVPLGFVPFLILVIPLTTRFLVFMVCFMYLWPVFLFHGSYSQPFSITGTVYCTLVGLFLGVVLVRLNGLPRQVPLARARRVLLGTWVPVFCLVSLLFLDYKDVFFSGASCPERIQILYGHCSDVKHLRVKDLGGFIDSAHVARFDIRPEGLRRIVRANRLAEMNPVTLPDEVWSQPPWWWNVRRSDDVLVYTTSDFPFHERGEDGDHYVLIQDVETNRVYVYLKANF